MMNEWLEKLAQYLVEQGDLDGANVIKKTMQRGDLIGKFVAIPGNQPNIGWLPIPGNELEKTVTFCIALALWLTSCE
jgi:hypothetical protein